MTKNEDLKAILPCPFCGGEGEYYQPNEDIVVIACLTCNAESGYYDGEDSTTLDDAVKFWNTRNGKLTRPTVTPADTAMEDASDRSVPILNSWNLPTNKADTGASSTTDGDVEMALEAVQAWFDSIEWREETGKPFKYKDSEEVLYKHGETIRTALQTRRAFRTEDASDEDIAAVEAAKYGKPPVDTLAVPREVLQGVREALEFYARHEHWMAFDDTDPMRRVLTAMKNSKAGNQDGWEQAEENLGSLDAVLSEGK